MKGIYRLNIDYGRSGNLTGIFTAEKKDVNAIIGIDIWFGEVLGKHSEVEGTIENDEIELITEDVDAVSMFDDYDLETGHNPFDYIDDEVFEDE